MQWVQSGSATFEVKVALSDNGPYRLPRNDLHVQALQQHEALAKLGRRRFRRQAYDAPSLLVAQESQKHLPMTACLKGLRRLSTIRRRPLA